MLKDNNIYNDPKMKIKNWSTQVCKREGKGAQVAYCIGTKKEVNL